MYSWFRSLSWQDIFADSRKLISIAIPLVFTLGCFAVTLFVDRTLLLWFDPIASAAAISAGNLYWAFACLPVSMLGFTTPLVAQAIGSQDHAKVSKTIWQTGWITLFSMPYYIVLILFAKLLFDQFQHGEELSAAEVSYFQLLMTVAPGAMLEAGLSAFFVGRGSTWTVLVINLISMATNLILDWWLIFGGLGIPSMGVVGAALATSLSMWLKVACYAGLLFRISFTESFHRHAAAFNRKIAMGIALPGSTLGLQQLLKSTLMSYVLLAIGALSAIELAATSAALSLYQLLCTPMIGLSAAVTVLAAQRFTSQGVGSAQRVTLLGLGLGLIYTGLYSVLFIGWPGLFTSFLANGLSPQEVEDVLPLAGQLLTYASIFAIGELLTQIFSAGLKATGKTAVLLSIALLATGMVAMISFLSPAHLKLTAQFWWQILIGWSLLQALMLLAVVGRSLSLNENVVS